jgi:hypothetical protein
VNANTTKKLLKVALMVGTIIAYGTIHKGEKALNEKINEHYAEESETQTEQDS